MCGIGKDFCGSSRKEVFEVHPSWSVYSTNSSILKDPDPPVHNVTKSGRNANPLALQGPNSPGKHTSSPSFQHINPPMCQNITYQVPSSGSNLFSFRLTLGHRIQAVSQMTRAH